jgi:hypothetical protein
MQQHTDVSSESDAYTALTFGERSELYISTLLRCGTCACSTIVNSIDCHVYTHTSSHHLWIGSIVFDFAEDV